MSPSTPSADLINSKGALSASLGLILPLRSGSRVGTPAVWTSHEPLLPATRSTKYRTELDHAILDDLPSIVWAANLAAWSCMSRSGGSGPRSSRWHRI